jgi:hypothetical protein
MSTVEYIIPNAKGDRQKTVKLSVEILPCLSVYICKANAKQKKLQNKNYKLHFYNYETTMYKKIVEQDTYNRKYKNS